jgi:nucleoside-diphosphate-sugar epimerase
MAHDARVLVTGASGFLGRHIVYYFTGIGIDVIAGVRRPDASEVPAVRLDLADVGSIESAIAATRATHIINCAAYGVEQSLQNYSDAFSVNVKGCSDLMKAAARAGASRFVQVGSCSEYANSDRPIPETTPPQPQNLYAVCKAVASTMVLDLGPALGLDVVVVRPFSMWGPGEHAYRLLPQILAACRASRPLALTTCEIIRDYSFVADTAAWIGRVALSADVAPGTIINIGSGKAVLLREFALSAAAYLGGVSLLKFGTRPERPNEPRSWIADVTRLERLIGPLRHTRFEDGLEQMLKASVV